MNISGERGQSLSLSQTILDTLYSGWLSVLHEVLAQLSFY